MPQGVSSNTTTNEISDPRIAAVRNRPKIAVTPVYRAYLRQQTDSIIGNGGSEADVLTFLREEGLNVPEPVIPEDITMTTPSGPPDVEAPGFWRGLSMRAMQGVTFGFGDEAIGGMLGLLTGVGARRGVSEYREEMRLWNQEHRKLGFAAELAGGALTGGALVKGGAKALAAAGIGGARAAGGAALGQSAPLIQQAGATLTSRLVTAAGQGGLAGGVYGAGSAEGGLSDRARGALFGAVGGAIAGPALVGAGRAAGSVLRPVGRAATSWAPAIQRRLPGIGTPEQHARELAVRALHQDGITVGQAISRAETLAQTGAPITLADIGGDATIRLAADAVGVRSPNKNRLLEILMGRQSDQGERMVGRLIQSVFRGDKLGLRNAYDAVDALRTARAAAAEPLYKAAYEEVVTVTPRMRELLTKNATLRQAWEGARRLAADEDLAGIGHGLAVPRLPSGGPQLPTSGNLPPEAVASLERALEKAGVARFPKELPVRGLDLMKRSLNTIIERTTGEGKPIMDRRAGETLRSMLNEMLDEVDTQISSYAEARAVFRGFAEAENAIGLGREAYKRAPELMQRELKKLTPADRDFYRLGFVQSLYEDIGRVTNEGRDFASDFFGAKLFGSSTTNRARQLRALFGDDADEIAMQFQRYVAAEARLSYSTQGTVRRATSQPLHAREEAVEGFLPNVRATPGIMLAAAGRQALVRTGMRWAQNVGDDLAILYSKGAGNTNELLSFLHGLRAVEGDLTRRGIGARVAAVATGQAIGMAQ